MQGLLKHAYFFSLAWCLYSSMTFLNTVTEYNPYSESS